MRHSVNKVTLCMWSFAQQSAFVLRAWTHSRVLFNTRYKFYYRVDALLNTKTTSLLSKAAHVLPHSSDGYSLQMCVCVGIISKQYRDIVFDADNFVTKFWSVCKIRFLSLPKCALIIEQIKYSFALTMWTLRVWVWHLHYRHAKKGKWYKIALYLFIKNCSSARFSDKYDKIARLSQWMNSKSFTFVHHFAKGSLWWSREKEKRRELCLFWPTLNYGCIT